MSIHCKHFVTRKKRYCRMTLKKGEDYCGEHLPHVQVLNEDDSKTRIPCPLDPKHTCFANKLKKHLKKCNARETVPLPYIQKDINSGQQHNETKQSRSLANVSQLVLLEVISKVNKIHKDIINNTILEKFQTYYLLENELSNPNFGNTTRKHLTQTSAILGLLNDYKLLRPDTCYVEFGAGKGKLSYWVSKTLGVLNYSTSSVLLIERASHRHKCDNKLDKNSGQVIRIRADIADLILSKVDVVNKSKNVVGVTKHLCGDATDLALKCLTNYQDVKNEVSGLIMTFCCHHRCQWFNYVGKPFFEEVGLSSADFDVMCGLVSWAVCGTGQSREHRTNFEHFTEEPLSNSTIGLSIKEKEEVGKKCKDLLNYGRKVYLQSFGFKSLLCYYVNRDVSLENVCIVGVKENKEIL